MIQNHAGTSMSSPPAVRSSPVIMTSAKDRPRLRLRLQEELLMDSSSKQQNSCSTSSLVPLLKAKASPGWSPSVSVTSSLTPAQIGRAGKTKASPTMLTSSPPTFSGKRQPFQSCRIMWVHFQASICTEWEQSSMILAPGSQIGARVTTNTATEEYNRKQRQANVTSILEALAGFDAQQSSQKKPKTIHRCILQRVTKHKDGMSVLNCHVCDHSYSSYQQYYEHLINNSCSMQKKAKDLSMVPLPVLDSQRKSNVSSQMSRTRPSNWRTGRSSGLIKSNGNEEKRSKDSPTTPTQRYPLIRQTSAKYFKFHQKELPAEVTETNCLLADEIKMEKMVLAAEEVKRQKLDFPTPDVADSDVEMITPRSAEISPTETISPDTTNDEDGASTPLNLSTSQERRQVSNGYQSISPMSTPNSPDSFTLPSLLPIKKRKSLVTEADVGPPKRASPEQDCQKCLHVAVATLPALTVMENAADQAKLANLKAQLTGLLVSLLGDRRLGEMGYPESDILALLQSVLEAAKAEVQSSEVPCEAGNNCTEFSSLLSTKQMVYRRTRAEIAAARRNITTLLKICIPEEEKWKSFQWDENQVEKILQDIQEKGIGGIGN